MTTTALTRIQECMYSPQALVEFANVLSDRARPFIQSVLIAVDARPDLQQCTPETIRTAALRAATLGLSCDPALKQAQLIPYKNGDSGRYEAQFSVHYLGLYNLAMRSERYEVIDVLPFPDGWSLRKNLRTHTEDVVDEAGKSHEFAPKIDPKTAGAWLGYLRAKDGTVKQVWMTKAEIHQHAMLYNPRGYRNPRSLWQDPDKCWLMERKTVLRELLKWADKAGMGTPTLHKILEQDDVIDAKAEDVPERIPDEKWDRWQALVQRAYICEIKAAEIDRSTTSMEELRAAYNALKPHVEQREKEMGLPVYRSRRMK